MPKNEIDPEDPLELCRVGLATGEDTTNVMAECLVEEYLRLGYKPNQLLALFRNPFYTGLHLVIENRGEAYVREVIRDTFARWGRPCVWDAEPLQRGTSLQSATIPAGGPDADGAVREESR